MMTVFLIVAAAAHILASYMCQRVGHPEFATTLKALSVAFGVFALTAVLF